MLGNSSQQPELGHFTLEWALNSSFHWFIRGSWEQERQETQLSKEHCMPGCVLVHPEGVAWGGQLGPLIVPVHPFPPRSCKVDPRAVFQCSGAPSSKRCWDRCCRLYRLMILRKTTLPCLPEHRHAPGQAGE